MSHFLRAILVAAFIVALTFFPFVPGDYDPLAMPLSTMALTLGRVAPLLVPIGVLWLWVFRGRASEARAPRWLIGATLGACAFIALAVTLAAFASTGVLLATVTAVASGLVITRLLRRLRASGLSGRAASVWMVAAPVAVLAAQLALIPAMTSAGRNRVIANSAALIAEIEQHRDRHGEYPVSILAVWGDYKPSIKGIERYQYEPSGGVYNLIFEEPAFEFGARRFVVYNPRDEQSMTSHAQSRIRFRGSSLEARRGYFAVHALPQPHWKVFLFD